MGVVGADALWVAGSVAVIGSRRHLTGEGKALLGLVSLVVAGFGITQAREILRTRRAER